MDREIKNKLIMLVSGVGVTASVYLIFKYIFPIVAPFVIAFLLAYATERSAKRLSKRFRGNKVVASGIIMLILAVILLSIIGLVTYKVCLEAKSFINNYDYYIVTLHEKQISEPYTILNYIEIFIMEFWINWLSLFIPKTAKLFT